jgi:centromeric protein E
MEIYNENIRDLLNTENQNLKIHENTNREVYVGNLHEEIVLSPSEVQGLLIKGERNRHVGETNMNERSSRSHTIFRMIIESREKIVGDTRNSFGVVKVSHLSLVDLAGSERVSQTGAEKMRLKEGGHINKSLLALSTVISKLSDGVDCHIPYRDSKLTRILQSSIGGNTKTAIICTITPASGYIEDTISTLKFASRAKSIKNNPEVNEIVTEQTLLKRYKQEINGLKRQLEEVFVYFYVRLYTTHLVAE